MSQQEALICAYVLDGKGGARQAEWAELESWKRSDGVFWVHLDRTRPDTKTWLEEKANLDPLACEALLAEETRPRSVRVNDSLLVILRGVNLNPGADPEDMVSIRLWVEADRVISLRSRPLMAIQDIRNSLSGQTGPKGAGDILVAMADKMVDRMGPVITDLDDEVDELEDKMVTAASRDLRVRLGSLRRKAISLRRHLAPQREVMARLQLEQIPWLSQFHKVQLREIADQIMRFVEDMDSARERIAVMQEELAGRLAEQMNKTMYVLALVAAVFLPLGLLTGLLGINVGGIPGAEDPLAFFLVCLLLIFLAGLQIWMFRRLKWF